MQLGAQSRERHSQLLVQKGGNESPGVWPGNGDKSFRSVGPGQGGVTRQVLPCFVFFLSSISSI